MSSSSSAAYRKLSPQVLRELRRHVQPPSKKTNSGKPNPQDTNSRKVLYGCIAFTGCAASIPLIAHWWMGGLVEKEEGLTPAQSRRGAFVNSGSRDVGRDPNWDFTKGVYTAQRSGYAAMTEEQKNRSLPDPYLALPKDGKSDEHLANLEAFATGKRKMDGRPTDSHT